MKSSVTLSLCAVILLCGAVQAEHTTSFRPSLAGGLWFGETSFKAEYASNYPGLNYGYELVYPLDIATVGVGLQYVILTDGVTDWTFSAQLLTAMTDPSDPMTDRDWEEWYQQLTQDFVYTESEVSAKVTTINAEVTKLIAGNNCMSLSFLAGVSYQKISQEMLDFEGTEYVDSNGTFYAIWYDARCGTYDVSYFKPQIGFLPRFVLGKGVSAELKAAVGLVHVSDKDDHLLRYFTSESTGWGIGGTGRLAIQYDFPTSSSGRVPFVRLSGEYATLKADLEANRTWYGDDPAGEGDETGTTLLDLPHDVRSTQYGLQLQLGVGF